MSLTELAQTVLDLLAGQQAYFAAARHGDADSQQLLVASKMRETRIKAACKEILAGPPKPNLFTGAEHG